MSLRSSECPAPSIYDYQRQNGIKEEKRCKLCEGLGKYLYAHALRGGNIYKYCARCHGTGVNPFDGTDKRS